jgi:hypothetical protein
MSQEQAKKLHQVSIEGIWLMAEGDHIVVYVERDGVWYEAIRELAGYPFSHCITSHGLLSNEVRPADWLNNAPQPEEAS